MHDGQHCITTGVVEMHPRLGIRQARCTARLENPVHLKRRARTPLGVPRADLEADGAAQGSQAPSNAPSAGEAQPARASAATPNT